MKYNYSHGNLKISAVPFVSVVLNWEPDSSNSATAGRVIHLLHTFAETLLLVYCKCLPWLSCPRNKSEPRPDIRARGLGHSHAARTSRHQHSHRTFLQKTTTKISEQRKGERAGWSRHICYVCPKNIDCCWPYMLCLSQKHRMLLTPHDTSVPKNIDCCWPYRPLHPTTSTVSVSCVSASKSSWRTAERFKPARQITSSKPTTGLHEIRE